MWLAATPSPGPGVHGQRNLQRQINEGQFTPSGSLPGCLGLSHSPGVQRAALESYLPAPPPNRATPLSLLGSGGPRAVNRGSTSDDPLPESLMLSACSWSHGPPCTSPSLLPPVTSYNPSPPGGAGSYLSLPLFHSCQCSSPWAERGSSLFSEKPLAGSSELVLDHVGEGMWVPASSYWVCQPRRLSLLFLATCQGCVCREQTEG